MKYLRLTNTEECLKLAECLIGSKIRYEKSELDNVNRDNYECFVISTSLAGNFLVDSLEYGTEFESDLVIPLDSIEINPFKCMEHGVSVGYNSAWGLDGCGVISAIYNGSCYFFNLDGKDGAIEDGFEVWSEFRHITLDTNSIPNGAEIIEVKNESH